MKPLVLISCALLVAAAPSVHASEALAEKHNCLNCHAVGEKLIGPAFKDVAAKYKGDKDAPAKLAAKVKAGGSGVWGEVAMPPNPKVSDKDLKKLIAWVLAQK